MSFSFSLFGNRYDFTPKFTLIYLLLIIAFTTAALWQWQIALDITDTIELINKRLLLAPLQLNDLDKGGDWRFYPAQLQGTFDNEHQILLSNRRFKGENGFQVLTPFKPLDSKHQILVNRGWIAADTTHAIPSLNTVSSVVTISGVLYQPMNHFKLVADFDEQSPHWPLISKNVNFDKLSSVLNAPLYPYLLLLNSDSPFGYTREWLWLSNTAEPARHKAYAMQWLAFAFTVLVIFLLMNIQRKE